MSPNPYQVFAQVYDQDVQLEVPGAFFRVLRPLLGPRTRRAGVHARGDAPVLDLGCGSGLLTEQIAKSGARVIGVDASEPMLALARKRCARFGGRVVLQHARLDRLRVSAPARLALACQDVVNHLPTLAVVERSFRRIAGALLPGGLLAFDTVTEYCFETYWTENTHLLEGALGDVLMSCDWDAARRRGSARIISYVRQGRARGSRQRFVRQETVLHEYLHSDAELARALTAAGFERVWSRPWSPWRVQDAEAKRHRRLWCAELAGPGERERARLLRRLGFRPAR